MQYQKNLLGNPRRRELVKRAAHFRALITINPNTIQLSDGYVDYVARIPSGSLLLLAGLIAVIKLFTVNGEILTNKALYLRYCFYSRNFSVAS